MAHVGQLQDVDEVGRAPAARPETWRRSAPAWRRDIVGLDLREHLLEGPQSPLASPASRGWWSRFTTSPSSSALATSAQVLKPSSLLRVRRTGAPSSAAKARRAQGSAVSPRASAIAATIRSSASLPRPSPSPSIGSIQPASAARQQESSRPALPAVRHRGEGYLVRFRRWRGARTRFAPRGSANCSAAAIVASSASAYQHPAVIAEIGDREAAEPGAVEPAELVRQARSARTIVERYCTPNNLPTSPAVGGTVDSQVTP